MTDSSNMRPTEILDRALAMPIGKGLRLTFESYEDSYAFKLRLHSAMGVAARLAKVDFSPDDPAWGLHPWQGVTIRQEGTTALWVGVLRPPKVEEGVEPDG